MFPRINVHFAGLILWVLSSALFGVQPQDADRPIDIQADHVELDDGNGRYTYYGNVVMQQGSIRIQAARIQAVFDGQILQHLLIDGAGGTRATFRQLTAQQQELIVRADHIEYSQQTADAFFQGNVDMLRGHDTLRSNRIHYNTRSRRLIAGRPTSEDAEGRVRVIINPKQQTQP